MKFVVREIQKEDIPILYKYLSDEQIAFFTNYNRQLTYADFKSRYDLYFSGDSEELKIFSIVLGERVIGKMEIGYETEHKTALFDIIIGDKELWGKGLATKSLNVLFQYGFNNLNLNRIACEVYRFNQHSIHLMQRMNMQLEGILRQAQIIQGQAVDICVFSLLRSEYEGDV